MASQKSTLVSGPLSTAVPPAGEYIPPEDISLIYDVFVAIILCYIPMIVVSNTLIFWATILNPVFHTSYNYLLCSMSVADFMMGTITIPLYALAYWSHTRDLIRFNKFSCLFWLTSIMFTAGGSLYHLLAISIDRYLAVVFPLVYKRHVNLYKTKRFLVYLWIFIIFLAALPIMGYNNFDPSGKIPCDFYVTLPKVYVWWGALGSVVLCTCVPLLLYIHIIFAVVKDRHGVAGRYGSSAAYKKRAASLKITAALMFVFIVLWMPYLVVPPLKFVVKFSPRDSEIIRCLVHTLNFANSMVNATIYARGRPEYRQAYKLMLTCWPWNWKKEILEHRRRSYNRRMQVVGTDSRHPPPVKPDAVTVTVTTGRAGVSEGGADVKSVESEHSSLATE